MPVCGLCVCVWGPTSLSGLLLLCYCSAHKARERMSVAAPMKCAPPNNGALLHVARDRSRALLHVARTPPRRAHSSTRAVTPSPFSSFPSTLPLMTVHGVVHRGAALRETTSVSYEPLSCLAGSAAVHSSRCAPIVISRHRELQTAVMSSLQSCLFARRRGSRLQVGLPLIRATPVTATKKSAPCSL